VVFGWGSNGVWGKDCAEMLVGDRLSLTSEKGFVTFPVAEK